MDESEDSRQHRGADLSQRGGAGFGHAGQQGDGYLNTDIHVQYTTICFIYITTSKTCVMKGSLEDNNDFTKEVLF